MLSLFHRVDGFAIGNELLEAHCGGVFQNGFRTDSGTFIALSFRPEFIAVGTVSESTAGQSGWPGTSIDLLFHCSREEGRRSLHVCFFKITNGIFDFFEVPKKSVMRHGKRVSPRRSAVRGSSRCLIDFTTRSTVLPPHCSGGLSSAFCAIAEEARGSAGTLFL